MTYNFGQQRPASGNLSPQMGQYYDGDITTVSLGAARVTNTKRFSLEPSFSVGRVDLPVGEFTTTVVRSRVENGFSPRMFANALLQYSCTDQTLSINLRYRWPRQRAPRRVDRRTGHPPERHRPPQSRVRRQIDPIASPLGLVRKEATSAFVDRLPRRL